VDFEFREKVKFNLGPQEIPIESKLIEVTIFLSKNKHFTGN